jgi:hypothetical protein
MRIDDINNEVDKLIQQNKFTISDEVLFEQATVAMEAHYGYGCETEIDAYFRGAKWILKQFENK